jgi:beta-lactamase regulating signal transducer with metallopeptidase domain/peroxiredoxin
MNTLSWLTHGFEWVLQTSWKASVLVILVLVVQWLLGPRLTPRWRYGLWTIVLVRLVASGLPESPVSVFSLTPTPAPGATPRIRASEQANTGTAPAVAVTPFDRPPESAVLVEPATSDGFIAQELPAHPRTAPVIIGSGRTPMAPGLSSSGIRVREWMAYVWASGVGLLGVASMLRFGLFSRRISRTETVQDSELMGIIRACQLQLGRLRSITVHETDAVTGPTLYGFLRPRLLLPTGLTRRLSANEIHHVVLHELLHRRRGDVWINLLLGVLCHLHWFNPLIWLAARQVRVDMEMACDTSVLERLPSGHSRQYGETLLKCLESGSTAPACSGLPMLGRKGEIRQRIGWIARFSSRPRSLWLGLGATALLIVAGLTDRQASSDPSLKDQATLTGSSTHDSVVTESRANGVQPDSNAWQLNVLDILTSRPVNAVSVRVDCILQDGSEIRVGGQTDQTGRCILAPPEGIARVIALEFFKEGYARSQIESTEPGGINLSDWGTFGIGKLMTISGRVVTPGGKPVPGATVTGFATAEWSKEITRFSSGMTSGITDSEGRWELLESNPAHLKQLVVAHPDYVAWTNECLHPGLAGPGQGSRAIIPTGDVTLVLGKPFAVHGRVSDENGKGIPRANIRFHRGSIPYFQTNCISGDDGSFVIGSVPPDYTHVQLTPENRSQRMPIELLAKAPGFGAVAISHPGDMDAIEPLEVVLKPGVLIHGQVVDQYGVPARDVHIRGTGFSASTDPSGRFTWKDAPADNLHVTLWRPGPTVNFEQYSLDPNLPTNTLVLNRPPTVSGRVRSAATLADIESFRVRTLTWQLWMRFRSENGWRSFEGLPPSLPSNFETHGMEGRFDLPPDQITGDETARLLIEAEGYSPFLTDPVDLRGADIDLDIQLEPAHTISGVVLTPAGDAVGDAEIRSVPGVVNDQTPPRMIAATTTEMALLLTSRMTRSDTDGHFRLSVFPLQIFEELLKVIPLGRPIQFDSASVAYPRSMFVTVNHDLGTAEYPLDAFPDDGRTVLQSTGSIRGRVGAGSADEPTYAIAVRRLIDGVTQVIPSQPTEPISCDAEGWFQVHKLIPGEYAVNLTFTQTSGRRTSWDAAQVTVNPGQTNTVQVFGETRIARGRLKFVGDRRQVDWPRLSLQSAGGSSGLQARFHATGSGLYPRSSAATAEGQTAPARAKRVLLNVQADGSFTTGHLMPGSYDLFAAVTDDTPTLIEKLSVDGTPWARANADARTRRSFPGGPLRHFDLLVPRTQAGESATFSTFGAMPIGYVLHEIMIPPGPASGSVDLGELEITPARNLRLGQAAPPFDMETLGGGRLRLSDYAGKWLTLVFWKRDSESCQRESEGLRILSPEFEKNAQLQLAMIVLDDDRDKARAADPRGPACPRGYDGPWQTSRAVKDYGVIAVPAVFLIDPEGKIAGYNLWVRPLAEVLDKI